MKFVDDDVDDDDVREVRLAVVVPYYHHLEDRPGCNYDKCLLVESD